MTVCRQKKRKLVGASAYDCDWLAAVSRPVSRLTLDGYWWSNNKRFSTSSGILIADGRSAERLVVKLWSGNEKHVRFICFSNSLIDFWKNDGISFLEQTRLESYYEQLDDSSILSAVSDAPCVSNSGPSSLVRIATFYLTHFIRCPYSDLFLRRLR